MSADWVAALNYAELQQKRRAVFRHQGRQIALFDTAQGVLACNNRCPHEGYPLREGSLDGCLLTCHWHNWKFDLSSGDNLYGGDRLRIYPTQIRGGQVWLDLAEPPVAQRRAELLDHLRAAFDDHDYERMARELGRLHWLGMDLKDALIEAIHWSYERLEFGWTHAYAASADWLALFDEFQEDEERLICVLESIGHIAYDALRQRRYPYGDERRAFDEDALVRAIDEEDETAALALLRGALAQGLHYADMERALTRAALQHYADFGHSLIYTAKAGQLIESLGEAVEPPLLAALVRSLIYAWREDQIPKFRAYAPALRVWRSGHGGQNRGEMSWRDYRGLGVDKALQQTLLCSAAPVQRLFSVLLAANAMNLLTFDMRYQDHTDRPIDDNIGWLSFTHALTFANAVRRQCSKFPELWPQGLLQMACFSGRNSPYTDSDQAGGLVRWQVEDIDAFFREMIAAVCDHGREEYIVSAHLLKTLLAAREETMASDDADTRQLLAAAMNRFFHSPLKRKHVRRTARQALAFVAKDA